MSHKGLRPWFLLMALLAYPGADLPGHSMLLAQADLPPEVLAYADMILYNGKVLTVDEKFTIAQAVAVRDGKFMAIGDTNRILKMAGPGTVRIDLKGGAVTPGFIESHGAGAQGSQGAGGPAYMPNRTSTRCEALDDCLRAIKAWAAKVPPGEWIFMNVFRTAAAYHLTLPLLDEAAPNGPLLVTMDNTTGFVNSKALATMKDYMSDEYVLSGIFTDKDGKPNGRIAGAAYGVLTYEIIPWPDADRMERMIQREITKERFLNRIGLTVYNTRQGGLPITILREIQRRGQAPMRIRVTSELARLNPRTEGYLKRVGNLMDVGDEWFKIANMTISSIDSNAHNAGMLSRKPMLATESWYAFGPYGQNKFREQVKEGLDWKKYSDYDNAVVAARYGWNVTDLHVKGDGGVELMLEVFDKINQTSPIKGRRFGMAHGIMRPPDLAKRLAEYDTIHAINPSFVFRGDQYSGFLERQYGADAVAGMSPIRGLIDAGLKPVMEVTRVAPIINTGGVYGGSLEKSNFFLESMQLFITRKNDTSGKVYGPNEKATREEVLRMATSWGVRFTGDEKILGTIEPGKLADMVVLDGDYMTVAEDKISTLNILKVIVGGKVTYDRDRDEPYFQDILKTMRAPRQRQEEEM
ncbi:MAG: amidohydrolase family protein [Acidobacteria bacterium]|nr:amidohydrolase family protein [Acidobacteriota bacterium]